MKNKRPSDYYTNYKKYLDPENGLFTQSHWKLFHQITRGRENLAADFHELTAQAVEIVMLEMGLPPGDSNAVFRQESYPDCPGGRDYRYIADSAEDYFWGPENKKATNH